MRKLVIGAVMARHSATWSTVDLTPPSDNVIAFASKYLVQDLPTFPVVYVDLKKSLVWVKPDIMYYTKSPLVREVVRVIMETLVEAHGIKMEAQGLGLFLVAQASALKEQEEREEFMRVQMEFYQTRCDEMEKQLEEIRRIRDEICVTKTRAELSLPPSDNFDDDDSYSIDFDEEEKD